MCFFWPKLPKGYLQAHGTFELVVLLLGLASCLLETPFDYVPLALFAPLRGVSPLRFFQKGLPTQLLCALVLYQC